MWAEFLGAVRGLRTGKGTTLLAFGILTLTMAAGTVTFSIVDAVAIRPLPYGSPDRLIAISLPSQTAGKPLPATPQHFFEWSDGLKTCESIGAARFTSPLRLTVEGGTEALSVVMVTANLFDVLGVRPVAGRFFDHSDERPSGPARVILSHAVWVRRFNADRGVIGREYVFDHDLRQVVGVLPEGVSYPIGLGPAPDLYVPYVATAADRSNNRGTSMFVVARLRPTVTLDQARADILGISAAVVERLHDRVVGPARTWMLLVLVSVAFVLLVACANVANLLLVRAASRVRELAIREALGASRHRLAAGLLLEGLILALASGAAGILLSVWGLGIAKSNLPGGLTRVTTITLDGRVLAVSVVVALVCGLVFASAPAWLAAKSDLVHVMKSGSSAVTGDRRRHRSLSAFLVADIAFVCVLLVGTVFAVTSFVLVTTADLGFDRRDVMTLWYARSLADVPVAERASAEQVLRANLIGRVGAVPGVSGVAISDAQGPLAGVSSRHSIVIPGIGQTSFHDMPQRRSVTPDYFRVMGMQLLRGRLFQASDRAGAPLVMLINDVAARRFFGNRNPVGQVVTYLGPTTIVGVLKGVRFNGPESSTQPELYTPLDQEPYQDRDVLSPGVPSTSGSLMIKTTRDPRTLAGAVREAVRPLLDADPANPEFVDDYFRRVTIDRRFNAMLMVAFGFVAVAIGVIGVYGTMAFAVAQQVNAIGIRMALGASPSHVLWSVLRSALIRVGLGVGVGLIGACAASRALSAFVFGVRATDPLVYVAVAGFLGLVGVAAALVPATRAARLDPLTALRHE